VTPLNETWRKSNRSGNNGSCVEVRRMAVSVEVRDTKDRPGPTLSFPVDVWRHFVADIVEGAFDRPGDSATA
jgi:hypothetical protein